MRFSGAHTLHIPRVLGSASSQFVWLSSHAAGEWIAIVAWHDAATTHKSPTNWIDQIEIADFGHCNSIDKLFDGSMGQSFVESPRDEPRRRTGAI